MYADCISHGSVLAEYDSRDDTATLIKTWGMPSDITSKSMYERMMNHIAATSYIRPPNHKKLMDTIIRIEVSPTPEETEGWTENDWAQLADRVLLVMDDAKLKRNYRNFRKTNLRDTMGAVYLHKDSKSGILHLHFFMCRADSYGHVNCGNHIGERAVAAADIINMERGWILPETIHKEHVKEITDICYHILRGMKTYSLDDYIKRIRDKGYIVKTRESKGKIVGYTIMYGNSPLNASKLSDKHSLTVANLENTWAKLNNMVPRTVSLLGHRGECIGTKTMWEHASVNIPKASNVSRLVNAHVHYPYPEQAKHQEPTQGHVNRKITVDDLEYNVNINQSLFDILKSDIEVPLENATVSVESMLDMAVLVCEGYVDAATKIIPSHGGGGCCNDLPNRKRDEDDEKWAHRCTDFVRSHCRKPRYRGRRIR